MQAAIPGFENCQLLARHVQTLTNVACHCSAIHRVNRTVLLGLAICANEFDFAMNVNVVNGAVRTDGKTQGRINWTHPTDGKLPCLRQLELNERRLR